MSFFLISFWKIVTLTFIGYCEKIIIFGRPLSGLVDYRLYAHLIYSYCQVPAPGVDSLLKRVVLTLPELPECLTKNSQYFL